MCTRYFNKTIIMVWSGSMLKNVVNHCWVHGQPLFTLSFNLCPIIIIMLAIIPPHRDKKLKPKYSSIIKSIFRRWFRNPKSPGSTPSRGHPRVTWLELLLSSNIETFSIGRPESLDSLFWVRSGQVMKTSGDALLTVSRFLRLPTNPSCTNIQIQ